MKKRWFALCMCIVMLAGILTSCGTNTGKIKFGAAGLGGTYRVFGDTFANLVTSKNKKYKMEVKTTAGSAANLRLLSCSCCIVYRSVSDCCKGRFLY